MELNIAPPPPPKEGDTQTNSNDNCTTNRVAPPPPANIVNPVGFCSGFGQYHTNEFDTDKPDKKLTPYIKISLYYIRKMVDHPLSTPKEQTQWLVPSTLPSRNFSQQKEHGNYYLLWADLDVNVPMLDQVQQKLISIIGDSQYEIYTTSSATKDNQKCRILIPLAIPLNGNDWVLSQQILNDKLEDLSITPDRANERSAQLCYLPNRGAFYDSRSKRGR